MVHSSVTSVATDAGSTSVAPHTSISCHSRRGGGEADTNLSFQPGRLPGRINPHSVVDTFRRSCGPSPSLSKEPKVIIVNIYAYIIVNIYDNPSGT